MEAKTKAQELGFLSREYAVGKDKAKWLSLFAENAVVQDPIGVSPLDPSGKGHKGLKAIEAFYDNVIANGDLKFEKQSPPDFLFSANLNLLKASILDLFTLGSVLSTVIE